MEMAYLWGGKQGPTQSLFYTVLKQKGGTKQKRSLCIFQLFIFRESASFYQVIVDAVGLDSIYQFQYWQTGADHLVLIGTVRLKCVFLPHVLTNIPPRLTLKLEILVDFPASANVLLTQSTMMPSDLSPPPSSSSTFNVYLKKDNWQSDQSGMLLDNNQPSAGPERHLLISCHTSPRVRVGTPEFRSCPPIPTMEKFADLPKSTA